MVFGLFRKPSQADRDKAATIKQMVREILDLGEETTISVSEIQCGDAACPGTETVILVMQLGVKTKAYKVLAPLVEVERVQVEQALAG
ncbi:hypothetical protein ACETRX_22235 [Labrys portucalensis]|uniref:Nitrate reductase n=1 Tax=Labrys neptuniae TaxID=376174 RepID=A0ABV6ZJN9_9HYPH